MSELLKKSIPALPKLKLNNTNEIPIINNINNPLNNKNV